MTIWVSVLLARALPSRPPSSCAACLVSATDINLVQDVVARDVPNKNINTSLGAFRVFPKTYLEEERAADPIRVLGLSKTL